MVRKNSKTAQQKKRQSAGRERKPVQRKAPRASRKSSSSGLGMFMFRWIFRLLLVGGIVALLFWQGENIINWLDDVTEGTVGLFGWGLVLVLVAIIIIACIIWRAQIVELARRWKLYHWNKVLSGVAFLLTAWGILALLDEGGEIGDAIIGYDIGIIGLLRVVGLFTLGLILIAPRQCFNVVKAFFSFFAKPFKAPSRPRQMQGDAEAFRANKEYVPHVRQSTFLPKEEKPASKAPIAKSFVPSSHRAEGMKAPEILIPPEIPKDKDIEIPETPYDPGKNEKKAEKLPDAPIKKEPKEEGKQGLKQVASEIWAKYGESDSLTEVDGWKLPPIDILNTAQEVEFGEADNLARSKIIEDALLSYGVDAKVVEVNSGPTVTQFGIEPGWDRKFKDVKEKDKEGNTITRRTELSKTRVKVDRIAALSNDLSMALSAPTIRIEAPIPGKGLVGIEVPNSTFGTVTLRGVIETNHFQKLLGRSTLALALGKGAGGEAISGDLTKMPHLLIAGATGSGKTVCLNATICCMLLNNTPADTRFIMIDPKRVELTPFNSLPHLATPVIVDADKALGALRWLLTEMDRRYKTLATMGARNIEAYNKKNQGKKMPNIVLIIDELADLMMTGYDEVEHILCRLAQLSRAVGIHLVVATQRPSVDVITGLIKANFPTRISFAVTSQVDSRTILDVVGAEKLLGRGDMLYLPTDAAKPKRLQGCFVSDAETERLVFFWNNQRQQRVESLVEDEEIAKATSEIVKEEERPEDPLMDAARKLASEHENISTSYLQRKLHIGYPRAARIMEDLREELEGAEVPEDENAEEV